MKGSLYLLIAAFIVLTVLVAAMKAAEGRARYKAREIMTPNEIEFFRRLNAALPDYWIFTQVAMSALIQPDMGQGKAYMSAFGKIAQKRVDYAIYDDYMNLVAVVELDDRTHNKRNDAIRDAYMASAGIRTIRFESRRKPDTETIRQALQRKQVA